MKKHEKIIESYKNQLLAYRYPEDYQSNPKCREITPEMIDILIRHKYNNYKPTQDEIQTLFGSKTTFYHVKTAFRDLTIEEDIFGLNPLCDEGLLAKNKELELKIKELENQLEQLKSRNYELFKENCLEEYNHQCTYHNLEVTRVQHTIGKNLMPTIIYALNNIGITAKDDKSSVNEKEMRAILQIEEYRNLIVAKLNEMCEIKESYNYELRRQNELKEKEISNAEERIENEAIKRKMLIEWVTTKLTRALNVLTEKLSEYDVTEELLTELLAPYCNPDTLEGAISDNNVRYYRQLTETPKRTSSYTPLIDPVTQKENEKKANTYDNSTGQHYDNDGEGNLIIRTYANGNSLRKNNLTGQLSFYDKDNNKIEDLT